MTARHSRGPRLFLSDVRFVFSDSEPQLVELSAEHSHYIRDVLRLSAHDPIELGDTHSAVVAAGTVVALTPCVTVRVHSRIDAPSLLRDISLLCALCKGEKNEQILDWATELGCSAIHFWQSSRSIVRLRNEQDRTRKLERFSKIALAAAQQSRQSRPPTVTLHTSLEAALQSLSSLEGTCKLLCSLATEARPIHTVMATNNALTPVLLAIGPEGDFSPDEESLLSTRYAFTPTSLGSSVLRSELAAVSAIIAIRTHDQR
jgi:16S rRNA (uracil1498-N3)-methyltransferase